MTEVSRSKTVLAERTQDTSDIGDHSPGTRAGSTRSHSLDFFEYWTSLGQSTSGQEHKSKVPFVIRASETVLGPSGSPQIWNHCHQVRGTAVHLTLQLGGGGWDVFSHRPMAIIEAKPR